jgi:D-tagatose-1,6-bisphosphate aldolase subunit GatZ/KbaZ
MLANPEHWESYYSSNPEIGSNQRKYSYLDRCRYYWSDPLVAESLQALIKNLMEVEVPVSVLQEHLPDQYDKVIDGRINRTPEDLIYAKISDVLGTYFYACGLNG